MRKFITSLIILILLFQFCITPISAPEVPNQVIINRGSNWDEYDNDDGTFTRVIYSYNKNIFDGNRYRPFTDVIGLTKTGTFNETLILDGLNSTTILTFSTEIPIVSWLPIYRKLPIQSVVGFNLWTEDNGGGYKWGYNLQLPNSKFRGVVDVVSDKPLAILDDDTWVDGMKISFKDVIEHNYTYTVERVNDYHIRYTITKDFNAHGILVGQMIEIDPTIQLQDADTENLNDDDVYSAGDSVDLYVCGDGLSQYQPMGIMFNLSTIPSGQQIDVATLFVYVIGVSGSISGQCYEYHNRSWNEEDGISDVDSMGSLLYTYDSTQLQSWRNCTVTSWVSSEYITGYQNVSFAFNDSATGSNYHRVYSKEGEVYPYFRPYLNVTYSVEEEDTTPPTYSGAGHNTTTAGALANFYIQYDDDTALESDGQYIFSTNNSDGTWTNDSAVKFTSTPDWANATHTLNDTVDTVVGYRWYANDTADNWNNTPIYTLTITAPPPEAPSIFLLSQTPSVLYANTTGIFNVTWGISHNAVGLNNSTISFIYTTFDGVDSYNHSIRVPDNTKADYYHVIGEYILRSDNRNEMLNFEDNATITEGNLFKWGGVDENTTRLSIEIINSTYTLVHWNGTVYDTVFPSMWYLDRTDIQATEKIQYPIDLSSSLITKIWDLEKIEGHEDYIVSIFADSSIGTLSPNKLLEVYYMNESYNPEGLINPEDSPFAFYLTSFNATTWVNHIYEPHTNSSYVNFLFINETSIEDAGLNVTKTGWLYFKSRTPSSKPYYINVTNASSTTNRTFGETNVSYIGTSAPFNEYYYTPNIFLDYTHIWHQFQMKLYVADNNNTWANSTLETTNITPVFFPPTTPIIHHFHYPTINDTDYDMNGMYRNTFLIGVGIATDPDGGNVTHNLTLHYANETFVAIINNTFTQSDITHGIFAGIDFNSTPYYSTTDQYTLHIIATDDENETSTMWLMTNFSLWTGEYIPPTPTNLTAIVTNDYIKFIWQEGIGNVTTSYNVSINGTWYNETTETYIQIPTINTTTYNITIWAFNNGGNGTLSDNSISLIKSIKIIKEVPIDYSTIQSLSILLIFLCIISLLFSSPLLSICTTIIAWYLAFNFIETPLLAIFFAIIGLVYLLNPLLWLGEK